MKDKIDEFYDRHVLLAPTVSGLAGYKMLTDPRAISRLTGMEHLFHGTPKKNIQSILEKGILKSKSFDKHTISHQHGMQSVAKGYVFTGRTMKPVSYMNRVQQLTKDFGSDPRILRDKLMRASKLDKLKILFKAYFGSTKDMQTLKLRIPYEELKKLGPVADPGWVRSMKRMEGSSALMKAIEKRLASPFSPEHTYAFAKDIAPKYIKGSPEFSNGLLKELKGMPSYIAKNPLRFLRGAGKLGLGAGLLGLTGHEVYRGFADKGKKKGRKD